jgi:hypothetical protein
VIQKYFCPAILPGDAVSGGIFLQTPGGGL